MPRFPHIAEHAHSVSHRVYSNLEERARSKNEPIYRLHVGDTYRDPVTERTVALYFNTPNNPSGHVLSDAAIDGMLRVAKRHDLWLLCDEAYEEIYYDREPLALP